ncbi:hypothetical protein Spock_145 [Bacillus phage Spock]|uniref:Uncharacterized protein n=1 Tax=Bacillus phage Spock TaxID=1406791 RepID=U5PX28_9CAUD|nr:hypothetical protein Spock_145 [Bacillus phage Spock]AGY48545.1 hypothetical protein Spock_145 [Bacillus phage Spock]
MGKPEEKGWLGTYPCTYDDRDTLILEEFPKMKKPNIVVTIDEYGEYDSRQVALDIESVELLHFQLGQFLNKVKGEK